PGDLTCCAHYISCIRQETSRHPSRESHLGQSRLNRESVERHIPGAQTFRQSHLRNVGEKGAGVRQERAQLILSTGELRFLVTPPQLVELLLYAQTPLTSFAARFLRVGLQRGIPCTIVLLCRPSLRGDRRPDFSSIL